VGFFADLVDELGLAVGLLLSAGGELVDFAVGDRPLGDRLGVVHEQLAVEIADHGGIGIDVETQHRRQAEHVFVGHVGVVENRLDGARILCGAQTPDLARTRRGALAERGPRRRDGRNGGGVGCHTRRYAWRNRVPIGVDWRGVLPRDPRRARRIYPRRGVWIVRVGWGVGAVRSARHLA